MPSSPGTPAPLTPPARRQLAGPAAITGWVVLASLLAATLVCAATFDRRSWGGLVGDEATYLMAAESLAWDFDLTYTRADYDRFVATWGWVPEGLILQSTDGGSSLLYGKPAFYPAYLASFVRLAPRRGPLVANALLLAVAGLAAAGALRRSLGAAAPWAAAAFLFASVAFAYVFWIHADLLLMTAAAVGLALACGGERPNGGRPGLRGMVAGALLAVPALSRPLYAPLLAAAALLILIALPSGGRARRRALVGLVVGAAALAATVVGFNVAARGTWTSYGGERLGFYSYTGFPLVELPADAWATERAGRGGSGSWVEPAKLRYPVTPRLWAWDVLYYLVGRDVGVLPYFLPLLLGLLGLLGAGGRARESPTADPQPARSGWARWAPLAILAAVAAATFGFIVIRPFNFYGGGGALANRYFLPLYPAFWFLAVRPVRLRRAAWTLAVLVLGAAPFLWPLWTEPRRYPLVAGGELRYVSSAARRLLPYETTLDHLKPTGGEDLASGGLWIKPLTNPLRLEEKSWLAAARAGTVEVLVGSPRPLPAIQVQLPHGAAADLAVEGAEVEPAVSLPGGPTVYVLRNLRLTARHRMWWTDDDYFLYRLQLEFTANVGPPRFRLVAVQTPPAAS